MENNIVTIENATFGYEEDKPIVKNISLNIPQGKITAIMGGSGSGKTTLLRLISGQYKPNYGRVNVFGKNISTLSNSEILKLRRNLGMLFQFGALFTDMTVYENVAFSLKEHTDLPKEIIDKIVAMKLEAVGLFGTQHMMPQELSGGMARRVALARSIALDPQLMLYDEPFTGLDPISLNVSAMLIKKLNDALGQTSVLVTHDIEASLKIVDYIYFMANGEIVAAGTPEEVKKTNNPIVRQFVDGQVSGPFNFEYATTLNYNTYMGLNNQMEKFS
jgi:phospholipid/cholesterol/gamma-HCH transport system ATP-binding protein